MKKIFVFGTRPEFIKLAPLINAAREQDTHDVVVCFTGQHREMVENLLYDFSIKIDYDLKLMRPGQSLSDFSARMVKSFGEVLKRESADLVYVHGDTISAALAAQTSFYSRIAVVHVEAGLRTYNLNAPYPEEFNRRVIALAASLHLAPTQLNRANLIKEGIENKAITVTGNTGVDSQMHILDRLKNDPVYKSEKMSELNAYVDISILKEKFIVITAHRRESIGTPLRNICDAIRQLSKKHLDYKFIFPVHLNPNIKNEVHGQLKNCKNVILTRPMPYALMQIVLKHCAFAMTDSGGLQEELPTFGKKAFILRDTTERREAIDAGFAELVGTETAMIVKSVNNWLGQSENWKDLSNKNNPFGDGSASHRIIDFIEKRRSEL